MDDCCSVNNNCDRPPPVYRTHSYASVNLMFITACSMHDHDKEKRTEFICKGKGKGLDTFYSAAYMSQTRDQQRFTISEVATDCHKPMMPQRIMRPSIARTNGLDPRRSYIADTPSPQSATLGFYPVAVATTHFPSQ